MFFARHVLSNGRKLGFKPRHHFLRALGFGFEPFLLQQHMTQGCRSFGLAFAQGWQAFMRGGLGNIGSGRVLRGRTNLRARRDKLGGGFFNHHACLMPANMQRGRFDAANLSGNIFIPAGLTRLALQLPKFGFKRL